MSAFFNPLFLFASLSIGGSPVWIETKYAFYILDTPSKQYAAFFQHFYTPRCIAQTVISAARQHPDMSWAAFMGEFTDLVDMFQKTWSEIDLSASVRTLTFKPIQL